MNHILDIQHLVKRFGGVTAVDHCSFHIDEGSITALIGPNGAGKTTMFDLVSGLLSPDQGKILFRGKSIEGLASYQRSRLGIARTFQAIRVFPELSALDNVLLAMPRFPDNFTALFQKFSGSLRELQHQALALLEKVHLKEKAHHKAGSLSYGQQKLLEIIRGVATDADLFLLDEPAAGVNRTLLKTIVHLIKELKAAGKTVMIVEHDMGFVMELSDRVIVMDYGKEIAEGTPQEIQNNPKVLEAYLGTPHAQHQTT